ncbi:unnamed protein product [Linum tenue]|uniref:Uncharacterized protein n=1 Tax=Linum tenue TaxID=586396 RepID=A0AAV0NY87_9ROSI|nr:unnamed protein product [Linum tenue]
MESGKKGTSGGSNNNQAAGSGKPAGSSSSSFSYSSATGSGIMKAPGADHQIPRADFEKNPAAYFQNLHKK